MKALRSAMPSAIALAAVALCAVQPTQARSNAGAYLGASTAGMSVERVNTTGYRYRGDCRDYEYRRHHSAYCRRSISGDGRIGVSDDRYRDNCHDRIYRQRYLAYCSQYDSDAGGNPRGDFGNLD